MRIGLENAAARVHEHSLTHKAAADHIQPSSLTARIQRHGKVEQMA